MTETATGGQSTEQPLTIEGVGRVTDEWRKGRGRFLDLADVSGSRNTGIGAYLMGHKNENIANVLKPFGMNERVYRTAVRKVALAVEPRPAFIVFDPGGRDTDGNREDLPGGLYDAPATDDEFLADGAARDDWRDQRARDTAAHEAKWAAYYSR